MALVDAANKELEATRIRLDESSARLTDLESRLSEEKSKGAQADSSLAQMKGEIEAHKASLLKAHATIETLNEEIQAYGVKVSCMERDRESLEGRLREEEDVRVRAQEDLLAASRAIEAQVEAKGAAQKALEELRAQLHDQEARRDQEHVSTRLGPPYPPYPP
jgi:chromosome segregation ATPase